MYVVAVTGGIGSGKSEAARYFASRGAAVLDLDAVARSLVDEPGTVRDAVVETFGTEVLRADGSLDRAALARVAFADEEGKRGLDAIVHPAVMREVEEQLTAMRTSDLAPGVVVIDVPLLTDVPALADAVDLVVAVEAPVDARIARCVAKGMAEADCRRRVQRQATDEERAALADVVVTNDGTVGEFRQLLAGIWEREVAPHVA